MIFKYLHHTHSVYIYIPVVFYVTLILHVPILPFIIYIVFASVNYIHTLRRALTVRDSSLPKHYIVSVRYNGSKKLGRRINEYKL